MEGGDRGGGLREVKQRLLTQGRVHALTIFLIGMGATALWFGGRIPETGFQSEYDPGPRAVPLFMGLFLVVVGIVEGIEGFRRRREALPDPPGPALLVLTLGLIAYVASMPYLGFVVATLVFVTAFLRSVGSLWWQGVLAAVLMAVVVQGLFVGLFKVPLPAGDLGLPF